MEGERKFYDQGCTDVQSDKRIDEGVLWGFSNVERMENDRIPKRLCM